MAKARRRRTRAATPAIVAVGREHWRADGRPKTSFASQDEANRASLRLRLDDGADLDPYRCSACDRWHLGNGPERRAGARQTF